MRDAYEFLIFAISHVCAAFVLRYLSFRTCRVSLVGEYFEYFRIFISCAALSADRRPCPEFVGPLPIRKTRAGLQFTCAAPTLANGQGSRDVWVCNSDGYVGQVCVLSLSPEPPQVTSCNGVCNARILCVAGIPACTPG